MVSKNKIQWAKIGVISAAVLSAGCAEYEVRKLHDMTPQGSSFSKALADEYKGFSTHEIRARYDDPDAAHFAMKGQDAAAGLGEKVMPETLADWALPTTTMPEFKKSRARLVSALKCNGRDKAPVLSAKAQSNYDQWIEQAEERWETQCINSARLDFYENLRKVEEVICPLDTAPQFHVHFKLGSHALDAKALKTLEEAIAAATHNCHCKVFLTGRTDAVASRAFNLDLSKRRADSVKTELLAKAIADHRIIARGFGEVPGSPQYSRKNRHVEIIIH